jgi:hypothetical protein
MRRLQFTSAFSGLLMLFLACLSSCENRPLHDNASVSPREIHEDIKFHFDEIEVDGVQYLILEKDNNNPHEGFGFMAFRANVLMEKQDTLIAYMKTITDLNTRIYAKLYGTSLEESQQITQDIFDQYLQAEQAEIDKLEEEKLSSDMLGRANSDSTALRED